MAHILVKADFVKINGIAPLCVVHDVVCPDIETARDGLRLTLSMSS